MNHRCVVTGSHSADDCICACNWCKAAVVALAEYRADVEAKKKIESVGAGQLWDAAPMNGDDACRAVDALCDRTSPADLELSRLRDQNQRLECAMGDLRNENAALLKENQELRRAARGRR